MLRQSVLYSTICLLAFACKKDNALDCFKRNGPQTTELRYPGEFSAVHVADKMEVIITQGSDYKVEVEAGKNLLRHITTSVSDGTLSIVNNNTCNFVRGYKRSITIKVTLPKLSFAKNEGVGPMYINDFQEDTLLVRAESSGDIHVSGTFNQLRTSSHGNGDTYLLGKANSLLIFTNGTNYVRAEDFIVSDYLFVHTFTLGDCFVNASQVDEFAFNIAGNGNIYYSGNPSVINDVSEKKTKGRIVRE